MNRLFFYSFLLLFANGSLLGQNGINQLDRNGKRHGIWTKKFNNGNIRYSGKFEHGKEIGSFKFYAATGEKKPIVIKEFNTNNNEAVVHFYTRDGILESEGRMIGKNRIDKWLYYYGDGKTIFSTEKYVDGLLNGESKTFYKDGKPTEIAHYNKGKLHGNSKRFTKQGKLTENLTYKNGVMHGYAEIYDEKGELFARGNYVNGFKSGEWEFNMDGEMVKSAPNKIKWE